MQEVFDNDNKPDGQREPLFPDLAPYGKIKQQPQITQEKKQETDTTFIPQPTVSEKPLTITDPSDKPLDLPTPDEATSAYPETVPSGLAPKKSRKMMLSLVIGGLTLIGFSTAGVLLYSRAHTNKQTTQSSLSVKPNTPSGAFPLYLPKNVPAGYSYKNDLKNSRTDTYTMSITGPHNRIFYITQQPLPINLDFTNFNHQLQFPSTFSNSIGTVTAGIYNTNLVVSIKTIKNSWVIINATNVISLDDARPIIDCLAL